MINTFISMSPLIITAVTALFVMMSIAIKRSLIVSQWITVIGLVAALISLFVINTDFPDDTLIAYFMTVDSFSRFYMGLILIAALCVTIFSTIYFPSLKDTVEEFYLMMLLATVGALILTCANHFAPFFLGLELLSIPMYGLIAYNKAQQRSLDSGIKYLILSAAASATLLFGMAILYAQFGTLSFEIIGIMNVLERSNDLTYLVLGGVLMMCAIGFKLSIVPFHQWAPDVYEGAPAPVSMYLATVAKVAVFAVAIRFVMLSELLETSQRLFWIVSILAILSMLIGNLLAFKQKNYARMLALSSVSHMGYALMALLCFDLVATNFYLMTYVMTSVAAFGVLSALATPSRHLGDDALFRGLFSRQPILAITLSIMLLSLAGIPLTMGFMAKLFIVYEAAQSGYWLMIAALIIGSGISLYYYLGAILKMFSTSTSNDMVAGREHGGFMVGVTQCLFILLILGVIFFGLYPDPLLALSASAHLGAF